MTRRELITADIAAHPAWWRVFAALIILFMALVAALAAVA